MSEFAELLGERIRAIRKDMKLSRAEFANMVELSEDAVGLIERGETTPRLVSVLKIANNLHIPITELLVFRQGASKAATSRKGKALSSFYSYLNTKSPEQIQMLHDIAKSIFDKRRARVAGSGKRQ